MTKRITFEELRDESTGLADDFTELCDTERHIDPSCPETLRALYRFTLTYAATYLGDGKDMQSLREFGRFHNGDQLKTNAKVQEKIIAMGKLQKKDEDDGAAVGALFDLRPSAAIVREIAFANPAERPGERFVGVDLGAGSGITTAAVAIAGVRSKAAHVIAKGYELRPYTAGEATRVLSSLPNEVAGTTLDTTVEQGDVTTERVYQELLALVGECRDDLRAVVTETFNHITPQPDFHEDGVRWTGLINDKLQKEYKRFDPFVYVMERVWHHAPWIIERVRAGETSLFPDAVNGRINFKMRQSRIKLLGVAEPVRLAEMGADFDGFEDTGVSMRFPNDEEIADGMKKVEKRARSMRLLERVLEVLESTIELKKIAAARQRIRDEGPVLSKQEFRKKRNADLIKKMNQKKKR